MNALQKKWDTDLSNIGLPSNLMFSPKSEMSDIFYRLQEPNAEIRWCIFQVDGTYYVIRQELIDSQWVEIWTSQRDSNLEDAKKYAEQDWSIEYLGEEMKEWADFFREHAQQSQ